jgi:hypothetical protein
VYPNQKSFNFDDKLLLFVGLFHPKHALSGEYPPIVEGIQFFPSFFFFEKLYSEWRILPDINELKNYEHCSFTDFWIKVFDLKNELEEKIFPNLCKLVTAIMSFPHSSANTERIFSKLNLIKSDIRNRLGVSLQKRN